MLLFSHTKLTTNLLTDLQQGYLIPGLRISTTNFEPKLHLELFIKQTKRQLLTLIWS